VRGTNPSKILLASVLYASLSIPAFAGEWKIVQAAGDYRLVAVTETAQPVSLDPNDSTIPDGATVVTGKNGRAVLARGAQTMTVGPNSTVTLPKTEGQFTTVAERAGSVSFDVDKQAQPHFVVETPFLAAVVKGTAFTIDVTPESAAIAVTRGLVEVANLASGEVADVAADQKAAVASPTARLTASTGVVIKTGAPRPAAVPPLSASALGALQSGSAPSGGLTPVTPTTSASAGSRDNTIVIASAGAGGGGGGGGDIGIGGTGNGGSGPTLRPTSFSSGSSAARNDIDGNGSPTLLLAAAVALTALLGFLLAVVRARFN
jgi:hypothetical protein